MWSASQRQGLCLLNSFSSDVILWYLRTEFSPSLYCLYLCNCVEDSMVELLLLNPAALSVCIALFAFLTIWSGQTFNLAVQRSAKSCPHLTHVNNNKTPFPIVFALTNPATMAINLARFKATLKIVQRLRNVNSRTAVFKNLTLCVSCIKNFTNSSLIVCSHVT